MTPSATFITNGVERVVVNQMLEVQEYFLITIKAKHMLVVNYYLIVELYLAEDLG